MAPVPGPTPTFGPRAVLAAVVTVLAVALGGCELEERSVVRPDPMLVAEVQVILEGDEPTWALAYLHATQGGEAKLAIPEAEVEIRGPDGETTRLRATSEIRCLDGSGVFLEAEGSCFMARGEELPEMGPHDRVEARIRLPGGEALHGTTVIPADFRLLVPEAGETRVLPPDSTLRMEWTQSEGAWGYVVDSRMTLPETLAHGRDLPREVNLVGVARSQSDTSFVFPAEAGVFQRAGDMGAVLREVADGLPHGTDVAVAVGAMDANMANWLRGTDFHPSGQTRVPSLVGDGIGVFGAVTQQHATLEVRQQP